MKDLLLQRPCEFLELLYLPVYLLFDLLHEGLFRLVPLQDQDVSILIMCLKTSIVPVFDEVMAEVHHRLAHYPHSHVMPGQSCLLTAHSIRPELLHLHQICRTDVVILYSWVEVGVAVVDTMGGGVVAGIAQVKSTHQGLTLVHNHCLLVMAPESRQNTKRMLQYFNLRRECFQGFLCIG